MSEYFSDKEIGRKEPTLERISNDVWNGIVAVFEEYKTNNCFSFSFPEKCYDNKTIIVGFNEELFNDRLKAEIPSIIIPIQRKEVANNSICLGWEENREEISEYVDKYSTLDFIEFLYKNLKTPIKIDYHDYFKHHHLDFGVDNKQKEIFVKEINQLFERNGIVFCLGDDGKIRRKLPKEFTNIIRDYKTKDTRANELIKISIEKLKSVRLEERFTSLEKIWDAFERLKTYYSENKKQSIEQLLALVSGGESNTKEVLEKEAKELTSIGNKFQIRHFETNTIEIKQLEFIDYLFYRMMSFINMLVTKLEN